MSDYMRNREGHDDGDSFFCRFTFGQFFALLVLEVFTIFFVFYLGARYGREFLGLNETPKIAQEGANSTDMAEPTEPKVLTTDDPEAARMAKDLIAKARTPELKDRIARMFNLDRSGEETQQTTQEPPPGPALESQTSTDEPSAVTAGSVETPAVQEEKAEAPVATTVDELKPEEPDADVSPNTAIKIKSADNARYSVQVGSYPQIAEANRNVERWKTKGYPAYVMIADIPERGRWYRVRIGGFATREDAAKYLKDFQSKEDAEALIVMNEQ